LIKDISTSSRA